jgi:hypothetical protein
MQMASPDEEARIKREIADQRWDTLDVLKTRFPGQLPESVVLKIYKTTNLDRLRHYHNLALTATLEQIREDMYPRVSP